MTKHRLGLFLAAWAVLLSQMDEGVLILRDAALARAVRDSDRVCASYSAALDRAERAPAPRKASDVREHASLENAAKRLLAECVSAEESVTRRLTSSLGSRVVDRVARAAAFEDMVYVRLADTEGVALEEHAPAKGR
jgi:hypothetical protein